MLHELISMFAYPFIAKIEGFAKNKNALSKDFTQLMKFVKNIAIINKST